jgi:hypothetical protein
MIVICQRQRIRREPSTFEMTFDLSVAWMPISLSSSHLKELFGLVVIL